MDTGVRMRNESLGLDYKGFGEYWFMTAGDDEGAWRVYYFRFPNHTGLRVSKGMVGPVIDLWHIEKIRYIGGNEDPYEDIVLPINYCPCSYGTNEYVLQLLKQMAAENT